jgi:hypothetical protein
MLGFVLLTAPLAYAVLNAYLFAKIQPLPITFLPAKAAEYEPTSAERLAA